jgi:hypothetical protein
VQIVEETQLPFEVIVSSATAEQVMKELNITRKKAAELIGAAVSIKVSATKLPS